MEVMYTADCIEGATTQQKTPMNWQLYLLFREKQKAYTILILAIHFCETYHSNVSYNSSRMFDFHDLRV